VNKIIQIAIKILISSHGFLVFLTGQEEIETAIRVIKKHRKTQKKYDDILPLALYAAVPQQQQRIVFEPATEVFCRWPNTNL
jgi:HrpA-like RNA helicase